MAFVLDASVAVSWVVASQATQYAKRLRLRAKREPYHVPAIWPTEVANVLVTLERRTLITAQAASAAADVLSRLDPLVHALAVSVAELRQLAGRFGLTAHDAAYLALALELKLPIACGDRPLKTVLSRAGVKLA